MSLLYSNICVILCIVGFDSKGSEQAHEPAVFDIGEGASSRCESLRNSMHKNVDDSEADAISKLPKQECYSDNYGCLPTNQTPPSTELTIPDENDQLLKTDTMKPAPNSDNRPCEIKPTTQLTNSSAKSLRTTQSHPKMSRMPPPPTLFKVGRTTRSLSSLSASVLHDNSLALGSNNTTSGDIGDNSNSSASSGTCTNMILGGKREGGSITLSKHINSQDSLKSSNGRWPKGLLATESPIDSKGKASK